MISKEGDPYSWKYYYKLSKERIAARLEQTGATEEAPNRLFSQGPLTSEIHVASTGLQQTQNAPLIKVSRDELRQYNSVPSRPINQNTNYVGISKLIGEARSIAQNYRNARNINGGLKHVNSEALLQKTRLWEQRAHFQQIEATRKSERSLCETGRIRTEIDGQIIGAINAKLHIMNQINL